MECKKKKGAKNTIPLPSQANYKHAFYSSKKKIEEQAFQPKKKKEICDDVFIPKGSYIRLPLPLIVSFWSTEIAFPVPE